MNIDNSIEARDLVIRLESQAAGLDPDSPDAEALWAAAQVLRRLYSMESEELAH